jgi:hypothetical protein
LERVWVRDGSEVRRNPGSNNGLLALGLKEEWAAGRGDAGDARGVKGPFLDFGCWAERLGIDFFTIFRKYFKCENNSRKFL